MAVEGFYAGYFTGGAGNSMALFVFRDGEIAGVDIGSGQYSGNYESFENDSKIRGSIEITIPTGHHLITGVSAEAQPINLRVPFEFSLPIKSETVHRIETPGGPINAKLHYIRAL